MSEKLEYYLEHCRSCGSVLDSESFRLSECLECCTPFSKEQRHYAECDPDTYLTEVTLLNGDVKLAIEQAEYFHMSGRILKIFGMFAVTDVGIQCLSTEYLIETGRIFSDDWVSHMSQKSWVKISDFTSALEFAKTRVNNS